MNSTRSLTKLCGLAFILSAAACTASADDDRVKPNVEVIDRTKAALSTTAGGIASINGTYGATCHGHNEGDPWSVAVAQEAELAHDALTVTKNDSDCVLAITQIVHGVETFGATSPLAMSDEYGAARAFLDSNDAFGFYGNAKLSSTSFASNFTMTLLVSDTPDVGAVEKGSSYAQVTASVSASDVLPPDDSLDLSSIAISIDADDEVLSRAGSVQITSGSLPATHFAIASSLPASPTFADVDSTFVSVGSNALSALGSSPFLIPVSSFVSEGDDLTGGMPKWLILRRDEAGVPAYKVVKITFKP